jgi:hypothetical protein
MCAPRIQLKLALVLLVSQAVLCGCAHQYLIKLTNGDQLLAFSKPKLQAGNYHFTGEMGGKNIIPQNRVVKIKTVSVVREEAKPLAPAKPKQPKHWYFLWLA